MRQRLKVYIKNIVLRTAIVSSSSFLFFPFLLWYMLSSAFYRRRAFLFSEIILFLAFVAHLYHTDHTAFSFILIFPTAIMYSPKISSFF